MNIQIETIPHRNQRYPTVGDWQFKEMLDLLSIKVSHMADEDYEFLVGIHEAIEAYLCRKSGVDEYLVDEFDKKYEANRKDNDISDPGNDPCAPYYREHQIATVIERLLALELGVNWDVYDTTVNAL